MLFAPLYVVIFLVKFWEVEEVSFGRNQSYVYKKVSVAAIGLGHSSRTGK